MSTTITAADVRTLYASHAEDPVLYVAADEDDGELSIDTWASVLVGSGTVITHRHELIDLLGETPTSEEITDALPGLQDTADEIASNLA